MVGWDLSHGANGAIGAIPWGQWIGHWPIGATLTTLPNTTSQHRPMGSYRWQADRDRSHRYHRYLWDLFNTVNWPYGTYGTYGGQWLAVDSR